MSKDLLVGNGVLVTLGEENKIEIKGAVLIKEGIIEAVGNDTEIRALSPGAEYLDAGGKLIMPGFINCHHHLYSTFARGLSPKEPAPYTFVEILERLWWPLDKALKKGDLYYSALISLIDCIKKGTTTIIDHHESQGYQLGSLDEIAQAVEQAGIRASLCLGISDRYGRAEEGIEENVRFIKKVKGVPPSPHKLVTAMFGLHAAFTVEDRSLERAVEEAQNLEVGIHCHVAEAASDEEVNQEKFGMRVVERLHRKGALGPKSLAIHCVHVDSGEMDIIQETGTVVVHNPQSNMNNAVGVAPVLEMLERGIILGLGTDGMTSNMCDEVRVANILHKLAQKDPRVAFVESCNLLLQNNAKVAGRQFELPLGVLQAGAVGDVVLIDYIPPTPFNENSFLGHFLFGICGAPVDTTIVGGEVLMREGKLLRIDEQEVAAKSRELAEGFYRRF